MIYEKCWGISIATYTYFTRLKQDHKLKFAPLFGPGYNILLNKIWSCSINILNLAIQKTSFNKL